jgi:hypothetical protein
VVGDGRLDGGHNDAAPYNAAWRDGLAGFFDRDFAGPVSREWDLAFCAFGRVPLRARHVVAAGGFPDFAARPRRLRRFLDVYGWSGDIGDFVEVVRKRIVDHSEGVRRLAEGGDPLFQALVAQGTCDDLDQAAAELSTGCG